jgi:hypothetical protein
MCVFAEEHLAKRLMEEREERRRRETEGVEKDDGLVGRRREEGRREGGDTVDHVLSKGIEPVLSLFRRLEGSRKAQLDANLLVLLCCFVSPLSFEPRFPSSISPLLLPLPFSPPLNIRQSIF